ncbi:MAG: TlpA family protein disulfide reductase [Ilumatobacteraceae bacterium]
MPALRFIRRHFISLVIAVVVVSGVGGWAISRQSQNDVDARLTTPGEVPYPQLSTNEAVVGRRLPPVDIMSEDGRTISSADWIGAPLVLNFWYSTCEPCRREMPLLAATASEVAPNVRFVGVNLNDPVDVAREFADRYGVTYDLVFDNNGDLARELGVATAPVTLFVDQNGTIVDQVAGELQESDLADRLRQWFSL